jgi:hypothetical protein
MKGVENLRGKVSFTIGLKKRGVGECAILYLSTQIEGLSSVGNSQSSLSISATLMPARRVRS